MREYFNATKPQASTGVVAWDFSPCSICSILSYLILRSTAKPSRYAQFSVERREVRWERHFWRVVDYIMLRMERGRDVAIIQRSDGWKEIGEFLFFPPVVVFLRGSLYFSHCLPARNVVGTRTYYFKAG
mmetsp:Transcript_28936/g.60206  ORF Transcript_28936/g.60206 Transcript_28936/m.60206 type:complete len:129 (-) Transcript_28936:237-623(-)